MFFFFHLVWKLTRTAHSKITVKYKLQLQIPVPGIGQFHEWFYAHFFTTLYLSWEPNDSNCFKILFLTFVLIKVTECSRGTHFSLLGLCRHIFSVPSCFFYSLLVWNSVECDFVLMNQCEKIPSLRALAHTIPIHYTIFSNKQIHTECTWCQNYYIQWLYQ